MKSARQDAMRPLPLTDKDGNPFGYTLPDLILRHLHRVDQRGGGRSRDGRGRHLRARGGRRFIVNSLMEEAIRSSQLEGATTSRVAAKELLRSGREPRDRSERMIVNNYRAIQFVKEMGSELTPDAVLELHRIVTDGTLDNPAAAGRLQRPDEDGSSSSTAAKTGRRSTCRRPPSNCPNGSPRSARSPTKATTVSRSCTR